MTDLLDVLLLISASSPTPKKVWSAFDALNEPPEAFHRGGPALWIRLGCPPASVAAMEKHLADGFTKRERERTGRANVRLVTLLDDDYPKPLRDLPDGPLLLYVRGTWPLVGPVTAVVGTRRCSSYGRRVAGEIGATLGSQGIVVVSGGADGIDGAGHEGCLSVGGRTAAVFGTGVDVVYPRGHERLYGRILETGGALVSEYPMGTPPRPWRFPERNRIIAGMADRTIIVEAPLRSGAMSTARYALEYGREVWAVPGRITDDICAGSNRLLFDGAHPLVSVGDFAGLGRGGQLPLFGEEGRDVPGVMAKNERTLLAILREKGEKTVDNLAVEGTMTPADVFSALATLAASGYVFSSGPGRWSAVPE